MTVTELGMCHYFATAVNAKAYSCEVEVSRIPSNSPQIVGAVLLLQKNNFWMGLWARILCILLLYSSQTSDFNT
jgi:hypothetical protein